VQMPMKEQMGRQHAEHGHCGIPLLARMASETNAALIVSFWMQFAFRPVRRRPWAKGKLGGTDINGPYAGAASSGRPAILGEGRLPSEAAYLVARGMECALPRNTVNGFMERELTQIT